MRFEDTVLAVEDYGPVVVTLVDEALFNEYLSQPTEAKDYNPSQPRDENGRWASGSGEGGTWGSLGRGDGLPDSGQQPLFDDMAGAIEQGERRQILRTQAAEMFKKADAIMEEAYDNGSEVTRYATWDQVDPQERADARLEWADEHFAEFEAPYLEQYMQDRTQELENDYDQMMEDLESVQEQLQENFVRPTEEEWLRDKWGEERELSEDEVEQYEAEMQEAEEAATGEGALDGEALTAFHAAQQGKDEWVQEQLQDDTELPDFIATEALGDAEQAFSDMSDEEKFEASGIAQKIGIEEPERFELWGTRSSSGDYDKTRAVALHLQKELTKETLKQRGLELADDELDLLAREAWREWKSSSTTPVALLMQKAAAEELGGFTQSFSQDQEYEIRQAAVKLARGMLGERESGQPTTEEHQLMSSPHDIRADKGMELMKAHVRGTWGTTQYLMEQAGETHAVAYRAIILDGDKLGSEPRQEIEYQPKLEGFGPLPKVAYTKLPELALHANGASSYAADLGVVNNWDGVGVSDEIKTPVRVVLRTNVPREGVLSVPVYGQNIHSEQEVVVLGTQYNAWDAWQDKAPPLETTPIKAVR